MWRHLIGRAKERDRGCLFAAETLGCTFDETQATAGAGFDYLFNSFAWWNLQRALGARDLRGAAHRRALDRLPREPRHGAARRGARRGPDGGRRAPQGALRARGLLLLRRADADRLRMGLPPAAPRRRDHARAAREDRHRHLGFRRRHQRAASRAAGREHRGRAMAPLGAGRDLSRAAAHSIPAIPRARAMRCSSWRILPRRRVDRPDGSAPCPLAAAISAHSRSAPLARRRRASGRARP